MKIADSANIADLALLARRRLPKVVWDFLEGGAEDESTLKRNRTAFATYSFKPRVLAGNAKRDLSVTLFGKRLASPLIVAPTGLNSIFWRAGDDCLADAAASAGIGFALSTAASTSIEEMAARPCALRLFQLYPWGDALLSMRLVDRAAACGYDGLVLTADSLIPGNRERDVRNRFAHSVSVTPRVVMDGLRHPRWLASTWLPAGMPHLENIREFLPSGASAADMARFTRAQRDESFNWEDAARIRERWKGPFMVKGILTAEDAAIARSIGCSAVVVSNHGGRALDGAVASLDALSAVKSGAGEMPVWLDGGVRRGTDVVKALALGATAVMLGRATLYGLAAGGEPGVAKAISILTSELDRAMGQLGCKSISDVTPGVLERCIY